MISGTWYSWCLNWGGKCGDMSIPCSNTPEQSPGPAPLWGTGGRGLGPHHQNQNSGSPLGCVSQHPLPSYSGRQFTRMMNCASLLFKKDRRCVSGGLCVVHLLDLLAQELTKSGRATQVHFVPSTDLFFPQSQEGCDNFFPLKGRAWGCMDRCTSTRGPHSNCLYTLVIAEENNYFIVEVSLSF